MNLWSGLRLVGKQNWKDAAIWLAFSVIGSLTPFWGGWLLLLLFSRAPSFSDFANHGEFALYSAAMFASSFHILGRDLGKANIPGRWIFILLGVPGIIVVTLFYAAVTTAFMVPIQSLQIDSIFLRRVTLALFVFSSLMAFFLTALDNQRLQPQVEEIMDQGIATLDKQLDALEEDDHGN